MIEGLIILVGIILGLLILICILSEIMVRMKNRRVLRDFQRMKYPNMNQRKSRFRLWRKDD